MVTGVCCVTASAKTVESSSVPYDTYMYDYNGNPIITPHAYIPSSTFTGADLGIGTLPTLRTSRSIPKTMSTLSIPITMWPALRPEPPWPENMLPRRKPRATPLSWIPTPKWDVLSCSIRLFGQVRHNNLRQQRQGGFLQPSRGRDHCSRQDNLCRRHSRISV